MGEFKVSWIQHVKNGNQDSFQWEITGWEKMQKKLNSMGKRGQPGAHFNGKSQVYLAYLSGKKSEEAELNRKGGTTWGSFQQEISSLGVLNWTSSF